MSTCCKVALKSKEIDKAVGEIERHKSLFEPAIKAAQMYFVINLNLIYNTFVSDSVSKFRAFHFAMTRDWIK